jgi:hypothetical protein
MAIQSKPTVNGVYRIKLLSTDRYWEYQSDKGTWVRLVFPEPNSDKQKVSCAISKVDLHTL